MAIGRYLGATCWYELARWSTLPEEWLCDLGDVRCAYPPGTVALLLAVRHRSGCGLITRIRPPADLNVLNYLERIDFFSKVREYATIEESVDHLRSNRRNRTGTLTELVSPTETGFDEAREVIWGFLKRHTPAQLSQAYGAFDEVLTNVADHSAPGAPAADSHVQVQVYRGAIELAFGDLGVGFRESLSLNPDLPRYPDESAALRAVLIEGHSRLAHHQPNRGGGLKQTFEVVHRLGGSAQALTRDGTAEWRGSTAQPRFGHWTVAFPGTLVRMRIPKQRT